MKKINKTLCLPLKKEWYEMIESGVKTEEYREIKPYWVKRLVPCTHECSSGHWSEKYYQCVLNCKAVERHMNIPLYTHVRFSYGYTKRTMTFVLNRITIGKGKKEWGAPNEDVFIIHLGKRIKELEEEK